MSTSNRTTNGRTASDSGADRAATYPVAVLAGKTLDSIETDTRSTRQQKLDKMKRALEAIRYDAIYCRAHSMGDKIKASLDPEGGGLLSSDASHLLTLTEIRDLVELSQSEEAPPLAPMWTSEADQVEDLRLVRDFLEETGLKPLAKDRGYLTIMYQAAGEEIAKGKEELESLSDGEPENLGERLDKLRTFWQEFKSSRA